MTITGSEIGSVSILKGNVANLPTLADGVLAVTEDTKKLYVGTATGNAQVAMAEQEAKTTPSLVNGFASNSSYGTLQFFKDNFGILHFTGSFENGSNISSQTTIFTLPIGYRPSNIVVLTCQALDGSGIAGGTTVYVIVESNGNVAVKSLTQFYKVLLNDQNIIL